ncbi:metallophosphoesterase [Cellulophaga omnivescoria]|uniref:metallophosphoesterase n=1 Tax=Cellulophaga omnivescoria TaxID=1888890 RepID=UPI0009850907|nr:metallophosphoesterase [Cellulophaga omnivescoria]
MKKRILRYVKHVFITFLIITISVILFGLYHGASMHYGDNPKMMDWDKDGPYVFYKNDSILNVKYINGNQNDGFFLEQKEHSTNSKISAFCYFPLDSTRFEFSINADIKKPLNTYNDSNKILAISDIESGYKTFRDFLINNRVIDKNLNWIFDTGHLVLVGDFVDRGFSTTQVLWFIYKLEQDAIKKGGFVHFILGNHELKNMQGNYDSSSPKYFHVASILEKQQHQLYDSNSFIGKWMSSKNTMELINGTLFTHGGIHPDLVNYNLSIDEVNEITSSKYYKPFYPKLKKTKEQFLNSTHTGVSWYRGYFKDDLTQEDVEVGLQNFNAKSVVVGHTLQSKVNRKFNGKVIGIDVKHPKDYHKNFPNSESEGLLIEKGKYYRVLHDGQKVEI